MSTCPSIGAKMVGNRRSAMRVSMATVAGMVAVWMGACSGPVAGRPSEPGTIDAPPADVRKAGEVVRCLVDSPDGCQGCDKGETCVYQEMSSYDCVYVVYGTACPK
jgi:hypothetical protein